MDVEESIPSKATESEIIIPSTTLIEQLSECKIPDASPKNSTAASLSEMMAADDSLIGLTENVSPLHACRKSYQSSLLEFASPISTDEKQTTQSRDLPNAMNSRAYFLEKEKKSVMSTLPASRNETAISGPLEPPPPTYFSKSQLETVVQNVAITAPTAAKVKLSSLPLDLTRIVTDIVNAKHSIFNAISQKLEACLKILHTPPRTDWKPLRRPTAEIHPLCLLDLLVDLIGIIQTTNGIWNITKSQSEQLLEKMDSISVHVVDLQRRLTTQCKQKARVQSPKIKSARMSIIDISEALGRIVSCLSEALRSNLKVAESRLCNSATTDPVIAMLTGNCRNSPVNSPTSLGQRSFRQLPQGNRDPSVDGLSFAEEPDNVGPFIKTVDALMGSGLCRRLFESSEMRTSLECLQSIRAGLEELAKQRSFEWASYLAQEELPHRTIQIPGNVLLSKIGKAPKKAIKETNESALPKKLLSVACVGVQRLLGSKLEELSAAYRALYRFVASILGGVYEDPEVLAELTDASIISSYISMVGFLFFHDLNALSQWLSPFNQKVRRKIKQQTAPINAQPTPRPITPAVTELSSSQSSQASGEPQVVSPTIFRPSGTPLADLLKNPSDLCLTRQSESESILHLFLPHLKKSRPGGSQIPPADRVNRILIWLAWEGGLMNVYESITTTTTTTTHSEKDYSVEGCASSGAPPRKLNVNVVTNSSLPPAAEVIEDAITMSIMEGCRIVKEKFGASLNLFQSSSTTITTAGGGGGLGGTGDSSNSWTGRGEDILEFCQRVIESISLRYIGEIDVRSNKDNTQIVKLPRWKQSILTNLAKLSTANKHHQVLHRISESLPKLFGEFLHQSLFYSCPLYQLNVATNFSIATSLAATARLGGLVRDLDSRISTTQLYAESAVINSHSNETTLSDLSVKLADLRSQFIGQTEGVVDRHTNQIKIHLDRLEGHTTDINRLRHQVNSHQTRIETQLNDIKKFAEVASQMRNEIQVAEEKMKSSAEENLASLEARVQLIVGDLDASVTNLVQTSLHPYMDSLNELRNLTDRLSTTVRDQQNIIDMLNESFEKKLEDVQQSLTNSTKDQFERLERENETLRETVGILQDNMNTMAKSLVDSVLAKSKRELSAYLTENLSQCVSNHVLFHLDRAQQSSSAKRRFLPWSSKNRNDAPQLSLAAPNQLYPLSAKSLIQSTRRICQTTEDDLTSLADASSVMEEASSINENILGSQSWFADTSLLDLPDLKGGSFIKDNRFLNQISAAATPCNLKNKDENFDYSLTPVDNDDENKNPLDDIVKHHHSASTPTVKLNSSPINIIE